MTDKDKMREEFIKTGMWPNEVMYSNWCKAWQAAKESSSKELEAAKRHVRDLQLNAQANEEASYAQVARLVDERDTLKAEVAILRANIPKSILARLDVQTASVESDKEYKYE